MTPYGIKQHSAKLTEGIVVKMRFAYSHILPGGKRKFYNKMAEKYHIYWGTVRKVCLRETWRKVK